MLIIFAAILSYVTFSLFFTLYGSGKQRFIVKVGEDKSLIMRDAFRAMLSLNIAVILIIYLRFLRNISHNSGLYKHVHSFLFLVLIVISLIFSIMAIIFAFRYVFASQKLKKQLQNKITD